MLVYWNCSLGIKVEETQDFLNYNYGYICSLQDLEKCFWKQSVGKLWPWATVGQLVEVVGA